MSESGAKLNQSSLEHNTGTEATATGAAIPATKSSKNPVAKSFSVHDAATCSGAESVHNSTNSGGKVTKNSHDFVRENCRPLTASELQRAINEKLGAEYM